MYNPTKLAAAGALLATAVFYGVVLRFVRGGDPVGPILWLSVVLGVASFVFLRRTLSFELE